MSNQNAALLARIAELEAQVAKEKEARKLKFKVSPKGAVSVYGLQRFPVTLYKAQWEQLIDEATNLTNFINQNKGFLTEK